MPSQTQKGWRQGNTLRNAYNGKCLDAKFDQIAFNGTRIQLWECNGEAQQTWNKEGRALKVGYNGKCLDAQFSFIGINGGNIQLWECNGEAQQQWDFQYA